MKKMIVLFLFLLPLLQAVAQLPDPAGLINRSRELTLTGSLSANLTLSITEKNGSVRLRKISMMSKAYPDETEKRMIRFTEPADVRGTSMLIFDNKKGNDEMWIYLPALKKTRRIVSTEKGKSFMSSEFSNADMTSPATEDFSYKHLEGSGKANRWIIESIPSGDEKADEYGYSRKVTTLNAESDVVEKMEFYNFEGKLYKIIEIKAIEKGAGNKYIIKHMIAMNQVNGRKSEMKFENIQMNAKLEDSMFTVQNLER